MKCRNCDFDLAKEPVVTINTKNGPKKIIRCPNCKDPKNPKFQTTNWLDDLNPKPMVNASELAETLVRIENKIDTLLQGPK